MNSSFKRFPTSTHFPPGFWTHRNFVEQDFMVRWSISEADGEWLVGCWVRRGGVARLVLGEDTIFVNADDYVNWKLVSGR